MANIVYNNFKEEVMEGTFDLVNDTVKIALLDNTHTPDADTHTAWADVSGDEVSGTGYDAGGETLANKAVTQDDTDDEGVFDADDVTWSSSSITARYAVVYDTTAANKLICLIDFGSDQTSSSGDFTVSFDSEGIVNLT